MLNKKMDIEKRIEKLENRQDKMEDRVNGILQEISSFKPILEQIKESIDKLSENSIDKDRVEKIETKVDNLEKEIQEETTGKKAKLLEEIIKYVIMALLGAALGYFIK
jgi:predicted RNase H-like nuclease (RuvC/YqgF family)